MGLRVWICMASGQTWRCRSVHLFLFILFVWVGVLFVTALTDG